MTEKLTLKNVSGELKELSAQLQALEQRLEQRITALEKAPSREPAGNGRSAQPAAGIDAEYRQQLIAEEAYLIAERRGFEGGDPAGDWAEAERTVNHRLMQEGSVGGMTRRTGTKAPKQAAADKTGTKKTGARKAAAKPARREK